MESIPTTVRIEESTLREILLRTDIGPFIGNYVQLRKRGNDLVGLCPFHGEKTPSFHVHPDRGFFKCFGCGAGGDVIKFVQQLENLTFPEAARVLARRAGIEVEAESPSAARARNEKDQIYSANDLAAAYFHRTLRLDAAGEPARAYIATRDLTPASVESFKIGFAPPGWNGLVDELVKNGVDLAIAAKAGLVKERQGGGFYDFYRNRLMIPTYATTGEVVAFGGRALDDSQPKYLNTSTTPVYTKGRGLYALNVARRAAASADALIVVEGYLDCIALHQGGFGNAVASLGTAFTPEQAAELRKYAERIFVCFDADAAGSAATVKSIDVLKAAGCTPFIVQLPPGEDPDSFTRTYGASAFQERLDSAIPALQFTLDLRIADIIRKRLPPSRAVFEADALVRELPQAEWDRWIVYTANALGLAANDVRNSVFRANAANFAPRASFGGASRANMVRHLAPAAEPPPMEREVLAAFLDEPSLVAEYAERIPVDTFRDARYRRIYEALVAHPGSLLAAEDIYAALGEDRDAVEILATLAKPDRSSRVRFVDSAARRAHLDRVVEGLMESRLEARRRELQARQDAAFVAGQTFPEAEKDELDRLVEELNQRKKKRLGAR